MPDPVPVPIDDGDKPPDQDDRDQLRRWGAYALVTVVLALLIWWVLSHLGTVPATIGMSQQRAEDLIHYAGFDTSVTVVPADAARAGVVLVQAPARGWYFTWWPVEIAVGTDSLAQDSSQTVVFFIDRRSSGWETTTTGLASTEVMPDDADEVAALYNPPHTWERLMPNVLNTKRSSALGTLGRAGLHVTLKAGPSTTNAAKGRVYYQYPEPGAEIEVGQTAIIWISEGVFQAGGFPYPRPPSPPGE